MTSATLHLPDGRRGQVVALGVTAGLALLIWLAVVSPLIGWYQARDSALAQKRTLAAHMQAVEQQLPGLRRAVAQLGADDGTARMLLAGASDAIAGANLQSALQALAAQAGTSLDSIGMQPAKSLHALRLVTAQVTLTARWTMLVAFLRAVETAQPRMIVDSISLNTASIPGSGQPSTLQATLSVTGFRAEGRP
ncbi:MAG TPA: type II secretion system protein GspM [Acidisoma sp.]|uniref:type II secretion system protein GspM n=1 Tax=Acidisoma sp. TaxID=1872115 RepID=UPI002BA75DAD|nr:type II secretion system protein GspM [Acidisoma sp.]HTH99927.1 type II secretion system protein GspM [Acidisoma sp.]